MPAGQTELPGKHPATREIEQERASSSAKPRSGAHRASFWQASSSSAQHCSQPSAPAVRRRTSMTSRALTSVCAVSARSGAAVQGIGHGAADVGQRRHVAILLQQAHPVLALRAVGLETRDATFSAAALVCASRRVCHLTLLALRPTERSEPGTTWHIRLPRPRLRRHRQEELCTRMDAPPLLSVLREDATWLLPGHMRNSA
jgi:hypothetical protein